MVDDWLSYWSYSNGMRTNCFGAAPFHVSVFLYAIIEGFDIGYGWVYVMNLYLKCVLRPKDIDLDNFHEPDYDQYGVKLDSISMLYAFLTLYTMMPKLQYFCFGF